MRRAPGWVLADRLVDRLGMRDQAALLEWHNGPEIQPFWARISEGFQNHRARAADIPDQAKFLTCFKEASHNKHTRNKYRSASFDTKDCTQLDRMIKFAVDVVDYARMDPGMLTRFVQDLCDDCLGELIYTNIDLLSRSATPDAGWSYDQVGTNSGSFDGHGVST